MRGFLLASFFICHAFTAASQHGAIFKILDKETSSPIPGAAIQLKGTTIGSTSNADGLAQLEGLSQGVQTFVCSFLGYERQEVVISIPSDSVIQIVLVLSESELDEVIIESTRANRSIANMPTRTEVLTEEIDEAASMEPGRIAHLITHSTGIQVQTTAASSNGAVVRIQGLNGRYTQMLKDGFPMYGGFSGSLDVLQIPPLDLRQVEYVKGSASTLYGGGAIGGLINLLTKRPTEKDETLLHLNFSHIGARDVNVFTSKRDGKVGVTALASMHLHNAYDPDDDGFSDIPDVQKFNVNPKLHYYPDEQTELMFGGEFTHERRRAGSMNLIQNPVNPGVFTFYDFQRSTRYTSQFLVSRKLKNGGSLALKNSVSRYERLIQIQSSIFVPWHIFGGVQLNSFSEVNYNNGHETSNLSIGLNAYTNDFEDQRHLTFGAFVNHLWDINSVLALESGIRVDYAGATSVVSSNPGQAFALPRLSAMWKASDSWVIRLGGGMGYRMPNLFSEEAEPLGYKDVRPVDFANVEPEQSYGANLDFKYTTTFGSDNQLFTFNQMFYYNLIDNPILLKRGATSGFEYINATGQLNSRGFESQMKWSFGKFTWFVGYTFTDAFVEDLGNETRLILTPQHSVKGDLLFVVDGVWRVGWDYEYKSQQRLSTGRITRDLFTTGVVVERTIGKAVIFLNAENFTDTRQTRYESLLTAPFDTPQYTDVWAPLDGFFFNSGLKVRF